MEQRIAPIAIIVALIAFFVIFDRKEFCQYDNALTVQRESPSINSDQLVSVPGTTPLTEETSTETKPVTETEHVVRTKHTTEATEEKAPFAMPVVTQEDAKELNAEAIALYGNISIVEGMIVERSALPDPSKSDYPDCRFTAKFEGEAIIFGKSCPKMIQLIIDGFHDYEVLETDNIKVGDKCRIKIYPFELLSIEKQSVQQADDLNLFDCSSYFVDSFSKIDSYTDFLATISNPIAFDDLSSEYVSVFERKINNYSVDENEIEKQLSEIQNSLSEINNQLSLYRGKENTLNEDFDNTWKEEQKKDKDNYNRVNGRVWRNVDNSFWWMPTKHTLIRKYDPINQGNMDALVSFQKFLNTHGVQFILSLVPDGNDIAARVINPGFRDVPDFFTLQTAKQLLENGIETTYPSKEITNNYNKFQFGYFYPGDVHASETAQDICAEEVARKLKRFNFQANINPDLISFRNAEHRNHGNKDYYWPESADIGDNKPSTEFFVRTVFYNGQLNKRDNNSPILVLGNSFMWNPGTVDSFPAYLFAKMHHTIDWYRINMNGPLTSMINVIFNNPKRFLTGKRVVIMHLSTSALHATVNFTNIEDLDNSNKLLKGRNIFKKEKIQGNCNEPPDFASRLNANGFYKFESNEIATLTEINLGDTNDRDIILVIPLAVPAGSGVHIRINDQYHSTKEFSAHPLWNREVIHIPLRDITSNKIIVEISGKRDSCIALGDVELYR